MRTTSSRHSESLRALPRNYFRWRGLIPPHHPDNFVYRPALNFSEFIDLLQIPISNASDASMPTEKGKKRAASQVSTKTQKRIRTSPSAVRGVKQEEQEANLLDWAPMSYPQLKTYHEAAPAESIPVLSHTFQIDYNNSIPAGSMPGLFATEDEHADWILDERNLEETLRDLGSCHEFDLGSVSLAVHSGRVVAVSEVLQKRNDTTQWLLLLPDLPDDLDFESLGLIATSHTEPNHDILVACVELERSGRVTINGQLTLVMLPAGDATHFPFSLQVQVTVSLTPSIYGPIQINQNRKSSPQEDAQRRLLQFLYPDPNLLPDSETVTNIPFFYSILGPAPPLRAPTADRAMQPAALLPTLLPFQRRSVAWLLDREGKTITAQGKIVDKPADSGEFSFWERIDEGNHVFYVNRVTGSVAPTATDEPRALGAILAEEPGLGKTLEIISLILLNPAPADRHPGVTRWDPEAGVEVKAIKTTLIITPSALATQWVDELKLHAPSLKVLVYDGWTKLEVPITVTDIERTRVRRLHKGKAKAKAKGKPNPKKKKQLKKKQSSDSDSEDIEGESEEDDDDEEEPEEVIDWCSYVQGFDVVVTTYQTLKSDFNIARAAPKRPRREDVVYSNLERPRSPLILVEWNRVVMDEVQMVGGGNVEDMVSLIPRLASFAVSGTPARTQIADLMHVLKFLRVDHLVGPLARHWARLAVLGYSGHFSAFFRSITVRTTKASVTAELTIPQQTRFLVAVQMGAVERAVYDEDLESTLLDLGLDARGVDVRGVNRSPDAAQLRSHLRRLRAICTHPQVGQLGDKLFKAGALKSMEEVLQNMCDTNWGTIMDDCKSKVQALIRMAQLQQHGADKNRYQHCLETLLLAEKETTQLIEEIESTIATHEATGSNLLQEEENKPETMDGSPTDKGKGKERERERSLSPLSDLESDDDEDASRTPAAKAHRSKRHALKQRLREYRLVMHRIKFLEGDAYHMLGDSQAAAENAAYSEAETIRRSLLNTTEKAAIDAMHQLARDVTSNGLTADTLQVKVPLLKYKLKNADRQTEVNEIIENVLNEQSSLLWEWRSRMTDLLTQQLTPGEEADGQEYQRTLDDQGEAETYLINYTSLLADRREALLQERTLLAAHDAREKKLRHTKAAIKAAAALDAPSEILDGNIELQPEHEVLHKELSEKRKDLLAELHGRAIKSVIVELARTIARIHKEDDPEKIMLKRAVADLRKFIADQAILLEKLDADLALYRKAFNQRILYFRQLQEISDSVSDAVFEHTLAQALQECTTEQRDLSAQINTNRARQRYLDHLSKNKVNEEPDEDEATCILCKCDFIRGFITQCAHVFCEDCMKAWVVKKQGSTCPVCRVGIDPQKLERFAVAEAPMETVEAPAEPVTVPKSRREITYNMIDPEIFHEIESMPSFGDYGNKIQTLVRHLLYLQNVDAGAKSIVFSAWADSLYIVERALRENGISCLRIDQNRKGTPVVKKFAESDDIDVLLLHGERENAGLNITCASRVFLLESVVHHGFEVQAIARIDRMGQKKATEVFCYYAEDTVEKNILDLAARQGTSLYTKNNSVGSIFNVSSLAGDGEKKVVDSPAKKVQKGDFIYKIDDMMAILFPHMFEEVEYLIAPEEDVPMVDARASSPVGNAVAGPSRFS
ncbi:SNF2 family N-terminal domain-containing protein [Mycena rosella]|uniref:SNF2 family N-terminal domain-containing protein n=1 Tax=Mycena rosella TaxID=1033263 RepID=A0AAD7DP31_MYCRO|nr:SNF2 family N-terminal domain-containing protein [Mycena rosella]